MCATFELGGKKVQKFTKDHNGCFCLSQLSQHSVCIFPEWSKKDSTDEWYQKMAQKQRIAMFGHLGLKQHKLQAQLFQKCPLNDLKALCLNLFLALSLFHHYYIECKLGSIAHFNIEYFGVITTHIPHICHGRHRRRPCKFFLPGVNFYRFNAKNWQFTV